MTTAGRRMIEAAQEAADWLSSRNAEIVRRHADGETQAALARAYGLSKTRVWQMVEKARRRAALTARAPNA